MTTARRFPLALVFPFVFSLPACGSMQDASRTADPPSLSNRTPVPSPGAKSVGIVIFDGLFVTELVAPFDVYKHTGDKLNVFTVGSSSEPIHTYYGLALVPDYTFQNCPPIDVLVVPSGIHSVDTDLQNDPLIGFVKDRATKAEWVTSHCWGAFCLAKAGVLEGRTCMTFPSSIDQLQEQFPVVQTRKGRRFVVDGNVVTSGGGLAAFEAAVWIVEQMFGSELAQEVAGGLVFAEQNREYSRNPAIEGGE